MSGKITPPCPESRSPAQIPHTVPTTNVTLATRYNSEWHKVDLGSAASWKKNSTHPLMTGTSNPPLPLQCHHCHPHQLPSPPGMAAVGPSQLPNVFVAWIDRNEGSEIFSTVGLLLSIFPCRTLRSTAQEFLTRISAFLKFAIFSKFMKFSEPAEFLKFAKFSESLVPTDFLKLMKTSKFAKTSKPVEIPKLPLQDPKCLTSSPEFRNKLTNILDFLPHHCAHSPQHLRRGHTHPIVQEAKTRFPGDLVSTPRFTRR